MKQGCCCDNFYPLPASVPKKEKVTKIKKKDMNLSLFIDDLTVYAGNAK